MPHPTGRPEPRPPGSRRMTEIGEVMTSQTAQPGATLPASAGTGPDSDQLADQAAPLDALLVDAALSTFRRFAPDMSAAKLAVALARRPRATGRRIGGLAAELVRIGAGTSSLAPATR